MNVSGTASFLEPPPSIRIPGIQTSSSEVFLGNTNIGKTSYLSFSISNTGNDILSVTFVLTGKDSLQFNISSPAAKIESGKSMSVTVSFTPESNGPKATTLSIIHNVPNTPIKNMDLGGTGVGGQIASLSDSRLVFDDIQGGNASQKTFTISNTGGGSLSITGMTIGGTDSLDFNVSPKTAKIETRQEQTVTVTFSPTSSGSKSATLFIAHNAGKTPSTITMIFMQDGPRVIATFAGGGSSFRDGGPSTQTSLNKPKGVAVDAAGNIYIADTDNHRIRRVGPNGLISTIAGTGIRGFSGDGGPANQANLASPASVAVDATGRVYIADTGNHRIRCVGLDGIINTLVDSLNNPQSIVVDRMGDIYIADTDNHRIRRVSPDGIIKTFAGSGPTGADQGSFSGDGGLAIQAHLWVPTGVAVDDNGIVYIAEFNRIRRVGTDGIIKTFSGDGTQGFTGDGGLAAQAVLNRPGGISVDVAGVVYIADTENHRIRKIGLDGVINTVAGSEPPGKDRGGFSGERGLPTQVRLNSPYGVTVDIKGNIYVADTFNDRIRTIKVRSPDFDGKGVIDLEDFFLLSIAFGKVAGGDNERFDLDGNGEIGLSDFFIFVGIFGQ